MSRETYRIKYDLTEEAICSCGVRFTIAHTPKLHHNASEGFSSHEVRLLAYLRRDVLAWIDEAN